MDTTKSGIYAFMNLVNNKMYIGSTIRFSRRKNDHLKTLRKNIHHNKHLQKSFIKYGEDSFSFIILERNVIKENLIERELYWINLKDTLNRNKGYNLAIPDVNCLYTHSEETKQLLRELAHKQHHNDSNLEFNRKKVAAEQILPIYDPICVITNQRDKNKNKRDKVIIQRKDFTVLQIDKITGKIINEFTNIANVVKLTTHKYKRIEEVINGAYKSYKGFVYLYKNKYDSTKDYRIKRASRYKHTLIPIYQYDLDMNLIKKWKNVDEIIEKTKCNKNSIAGAISGKLYLYNYYWLKEPIFE